MARKPRLCNARSATSSAAVTRRLVESIRCRWWSCLIAASTAISPCRLNMRASCFATITMKTFPRSSTKSITPNMTRFRQTPCVSMRSGVASASPNWPATMWCSTACTVVAHISARIWRSPRWKAAGGARVKSRCTSMGTTSIPRGAAPVPRIISVARGVLPISTSMGVCMSRRSVRRTSVSHSIRSVSPRIARARIGM